MHAAVPCRCGERSRRAASPRLLQRGRVTNPRRSEPSRVSSETSSCGCCTAAPSSRRRGTPEQRTRHGAFRFHATSSGADGYYLPLNGARLLKWPPLSAVNRAVDGPELRLAASPPRTSCLDQSQNALHTRPAPCESVRGASPAGTAPTTGPARRPRPPAAASSACARPVWCNGPPPPPLVSVATSSRRPPFTALL